MFGHSASAGTHWMPVQPEIQAPGLIAGTI